MAMSAPLLVLIVPALFAVVVLLCFVGCSLDTSGIGNPPFKQYSTATILPTPGLVGYWPLGEPAGATTAVDLKSAHNGAYLSHVFPDEPAMQSAAAPGTFSLGNTGIVAGDTVPPHLNLNARTTCMQTNGGYVSVLPFDAAFIPTKAEGFTLEAWVRVEWTADDTAAFRVVMTTFDSAGGLKGFVLLATPDNHWAAIVGNGVTITQATGAAVVFETTNHLVATYDGSSEELKLYLNGEQSSPTTSADYHPATANALYIGAGRPDLPDPHFPFVGQIQCVALYKGALTLDDVIKHFHNGNAIDP
jgi:hypothetical protein